VWYLVRHGVVKKGTLVMRAMVKMNDAEQNVAQWTTSRLSDLFIDSMTWCGRIPNKERHASGSSSTTRFSSESPSIDNALLLLATTRGETSITGSAARCNGNGDLHLPSLALLLSWSLQRMGCTHIVFRVHV
jgi:hypothetical protein